MPGLEVTSGAEPCFWPFPLEAGTAVKPACVTAAAERTYAPPTVVFGPFGKRLVNLYELFGGSCDGRSEPRNAVVRSRTSHDLCN
jgi:hypothetical protein